MSVLHHKEVTFQSIMFYQEAEEEKIIGKTSQQHVLGAMSKKEIGLRRS